MLIVGAQDLDLDQDHDQREAQAAADWVQDPRSGGDQWRRAGNSRRVDVAFEERIPVFERPGRTRYVKVREVDWFEAHNQYVRLHLGTRSVLARTPTLSISSLARHLDPHDFIRVHRSHIVNLRCVEAAETDGRSRRFVVLTGERRVPVSQQHWTRLRASLSRFGDDF